MRRMDLTGMGVALITPFDRNGKVDYASLSKLVDCHLNNGTDYLVLLGTTAETPTLDKEEQQKIIQFIVEKVGGRLPLVMGVGGNNTHAVAECIKNVVPAGIDAILSVVPYYNKPRQEGIYQHYKTLAEASSLPIILYNVPGRTGVNMLPETVVRLAKEFETIIAIKEASGNLTQMEEIALNMPDGFQLISGDDAIALPSIALGSCGVISVIGNAFPKELGEMIHLALNGDYKEAKNIDNRFGDLFELIFTDGSPAGVKSILHEKGYCENILRLPLVPVQDATQERIRIALDKFKSKC